MAGGMISVFSSELAVTGEVVTLAEGKPWPVGPQWGK